ncbi:MAG: dihydropyrimidinase [Chloroflexota bacterium]|nr:dihydropyrimidinase [Chloroflexota bacterium]
MYLIVRGGTVVTATDYYRADVGVKDGRIVHIGNDLSDLAANQVVDAAGCLVFPGFVDAHVHLSLPVGDLVSTDDFRTGTIAAACGGTTTIIDFISPERGQSLRQATDLRRAEADGRAVVDYTLHQTAVDAEPRTLRELSSLASEGYTSLKLYTTYAAEMVDDAAMLKLLELARDRGLMPLVHTENHAAIEYLRARFLAEGKVEPHYHPLSRPPAVEAEAANRVVTLAGLVGCPLIVAHLTCRETLEVVERAQQAGQTVYAEVTPNHLLLDDERYDLPDFEGAKFVLSPPLRDRSHQPLLWRALARGTLAMVSTDHCPWTFADQKQRGRADFTQIPNGTPGIETRVPLLYSEGVSEDRLSLNRFVDVCAATPARLYGLFPRKGTIAVGSDADLVIFDPDQKVTLSHTALHQNVDYCPFEGWTVCGYPRTVMVRGQVVVRDGEFVGPAGWGLFLAR